MSLWGQCPGSVRSFTVNEWTCWLRWFNFLFQTRSDSMSENNSPESFGVCWLMDTFSLWLDSSFSVSGSMSQCRIFIDYRDRLCPVAVQQDEFEFIVVFHKVQSWVLFSSVSLLLVSITAHSLSIVSVYWHFSFGRYERVFVSSVSSVFTQRPWKRHFILVNLLLRFIVLICSSFTFAWIRKEFLFWSENPSEGRRCAARKVFHSETLEPCFSLWTLLEVSLRRFDPSSWITATSLCLFCQESTAAIFVETRD